MNFNSSVNQQGYRCNLFKHLFSASKMSCYTKTWIQYLIQNLSKAPLVLWNFCSSVVWLQVVFFFNCSHIINTFYTSQTQNSVCNMTGLYGTTKRRLNTVYLSGPEDNLQRPSSASSYQMTSAQI